MRDIKKMMQQLMVFAVFCSVLGGSIACSPLKKTVQQKKPDVVAGINIVGVLPIQALIVTEDTNIPGVKARIAALQRGAAVAEGILRQELVANEKVRFINASELSRNADDVLQGGARSIAALGQQLGLDAVLVGVVERYRQREGNEYAAAIPASVAFSLRLYDCRNGALLWSSQIDETQEALLDNLFSFGKAQRRGFRWILVEDLLSREIRERLAEQPYM